MDIKNSSFQQLVDQVNKDLGHDFCDRFRYARKELSQSGRASAANILFKFVNEDRGWVINEGGGVEIQYHLFYRGNTIGYGLGFNAQYVPFENDKSPVEYIKPFVKAFLFLKERKDRAVVALEEKGFSLIEGNGWDGLRHIGFDEYYLFGKEIQIQNGILPDDEYAEMIDYIQNGLFDLYVEIWKQKAEMEKVNEKVGSAARLLVVNYNLILTGAPGTGKTYLAKQIAAWMILGKEYNEDSASDDEQRKMGEQMEFVQFHPSYDYTDFVEGQRPVDDGKGGVSFCRKDGTFLRFCRKALAAYEAAIDKAEAPKYVFVIDEINRGELSKIFGELFFCIDPGYRGEAGRVSTQYSNLWKEADSFGGSASFFIPENVYIIGTMNDIDRSVESMDFAMRRRFAFREVLTSDTMDMIKREARLAEAYPQIEQRMTNLNRCILTVQGFTTAYQIGAAYFLKLTNYLDCGKVTDSSWENLWNNHLRGLLFEYLRGLPRAEEELRTLHRAYLLEDIYKGQGRKG